MKDKAESTLIQPFFFNDNKINIKNDDDQIKKKYK